jgi:sugar/nucleoside kinase (ribokinase family)
LWDVVGVGANSVDYVYRLPEYPEAEGPRSKMRISSHRISCGGQIATTLATCAAMGLRAKYVGAVGADGNGQRLRAELEQRSIDVTAVVQREALNAYAVILIADQVGERIVLWDRSEALALRLDEIPREAIASARALHVDDVDQNAGIAAGRFGRDAGVIVTSDIDRVTERTEELIATVTVPIFAEHVPPALTGESDPERALRKIRRTHPGLLCVTLGAHGSMVLDGDRVHHEPAFPITPVDTTGAGDVFRGAFIVALLRGDMPPSILRFANAAAAVACTRPGAIDGVPTLEDARALMAPAGGSRG